MRKITRNPYNINKLDLITGEIIFTLDKDRII